MVIKYEMHSIKNARGTGEERKYVQLRNGKARPAADLEQQIERTCSLSRSDVKAVMSEIRRFAVRELTSGNRFYLPEIGYLSLSVGNMSPAEKDNTKVTGKDIYVRNLNFRPVADFLHEVQADVTFKKSDYTTRSRQYAEDELWTLVSAYLRANRCITRREMSRAFGLSGYLAKRWLDRFVAAGRLVRGGTPHAPLYFAG